MISVIRGGFESACVFMGKFTNFKCSIAITNMKYTAKMRDKIAYFEIRHTLLIFLFEFWPKRVTFFKIPKLMEIQIYVVRGYFLMILASFDST